MPEDVGKTSSRDLPRDDFEMHALDWDGTVEFMPPEGATSTYRDRVRASRAAGQIWVLARVDRRG